MIATRGVTKLVGVELVEPNPWNFNRMSEDEERGLRESLELYGQVAPLVVRSLDGKRKQVLDGEHRLNVIKDVGGANLLVHDLGELEDAHAKKLSVILMTTLGKPDFEAGREFFIAFQSDYGWDPKDILAGLPDVKKDFDLDFSPPSDEWDVPTTKDDLPSKKKYEFTVDELDAEAVDAALEGARARLGDESASKAKAFVEMARSSLIR